MPRKKSSASSTAPKKTSSDPVMEITLPEGFSGFMIPLAVLVSSLIVSASIIYTGSKMINGDGTGTTQDTAADTQDTTGGDTAGVETAATAGDVIQQYETFTEYDHEICTENGKPVIYLFSTTWCPHCEWIKDTFDTWAKDNANKVVAYHWEIDTNNDTLTSAVETEVPQTAMDVYDTFNPNGSIPTFVFGCRYGRVGNGYESEDDLSKESASFDKVLQELL